MLRQLAYGKNWFLYILFLLKVAESIDDIK